MDWKEVNDFIKQQLDDATKELTDDKEINKAKAQVLRNLDSSAHTFIYNGGYKAAEAKLTSPDAELQTKLADVERELQKAKEDLQKAKDSNQDVNSQELEGYKAKVATLEQAIKDTKAAHAADIDRLEARAFLAQVSEGLTGVVTDTRKELELMKLEKSGRIKRVVTGEGDNRKEYIEVLQPGETIGYSERGPDLVNRVVQEVFNGAPKEDRLSKADSGAGANGGKGGGVQKTKVDNWRNRGKEAANRSGGKLQMDEDSMKARTGV